MSEQKEKRLPLIPHLYTAIAIWLLLVALYIWTRDEAIKKMMEGMFLVVVIAHQDGLKRIADAARRSKEEKAE